MPDVVVDAGDAAVYFVPVSAELIACSAASGDPEAAPGVADGLNSPLDMLKGWAAMVGGVAVSGPM